MIPSQFHIVQYLSAVLNNYLLLIYSIVFSGYAGVNHVYYAYNVDDH